jgi:hypothetical protein
MLQALSIGQPMQPAGGLIAILSGVVQVVIGLALQDLSGRWAAGIGTAGSAVGGCGHRFTLWVDRSRVGVFAHRRPTPQIAHIRRGLQRGLRQARESEFLGIVVGIESEV